MLVKLRCISIKYKINNFVKLNSFQLLLWNSVIILVSRFINYKNKSVKTEYDCKHFSNMF